MKDLISIIIPNRKGETNTSLDSIKNQTYTNYEVIEVIDEDGRGASWARNRGLEEAKGEYIFFCDNDLMLQPNCLELLHGKLQAHEEADWVFGLFNFHGNIFNLKKGPMPKDKNSFEFINWFRGISTMSLIRAKAEPKFDEELLRYNDWDLWIRLSKAGHEPVFCNRLLFRTSYREHGISNNDVNDQNKWQNILYEKHIGRLADIVIPHHNKHDLLAGCLAGINNTIFNIIIVSGGSFSENCNKGAKFATTKNIIFLNDDTLPNTGQLMQMVYDKADITGITQDINGRGNIRYGIGIDANGKKSLVDNPRDRCMPSGFCFKVRKPAWKKLKGLEEAYRNGAEDMDLFLRAIEADMSFGYINNPIRHFLSQSEGRFLFSERNDKIFKERWDDKLRNKKLCKR